MRCYVYGIKRFQRVMFAIFVTAALYTVVTNIIWKQNWLINRNNLLLSNICEFHNRYYIVKPFFNFVCDKNSLNLLQFSIHSEKHICDRLYSSNTEPSLFSRLQTEFQPFNKRKILFIDIENISNSCPSCHHLQIITNKLYNIPRRAAGNFQTRSRSVKIFIKHVIDTFLDIPDLDFFFDVGDFVSLPNGLNDAFFGVPIFAIAKSNKTKRGLRGDRMVLMPCFTFWSWPESLAGRWPKKFESVLNASQNMEYEKRVPKLFWRGIDSYKRNWFIKMTKKHSETMDVAVMTWSRGKNDLYPLPSETYKTLEEHCNYRYLLHQEGVSYSSRLKYLLLCGSPVVFNVIEDWEEYWYHLLENDKNIILFESNGNETILEHTLHFLTHHEDQVKEIGRRGQQLVQDYLNEHAVSCYWWKLLHEYAKLLGYKPSLHPDAVPIDDFILGGSI